MANHNGKSFTTRDQDNDGAADNCAERYGAAWWYNNCHYANLNGKYGDTRHGYGVNWRTWKGQSHSNTHTTMMVRRKV